MAMDLLKKSQNRSLDYVYGNKKAIEKRFKDQYEGNQITLKAYVEGIQALKKYELH
jgi:hypothetical protein